MSELLNEYKQQVDSLVQELTGKKEAMHKLRLQLDQTEASVDHVSTAHLSVWVWVFLLKQNGSYDMVRVW